MRVMNFQNWAIGKKITFKKFKISNSASPFSKMYNSATNEARPFKVVLTETSSNFAFNKEDFHSL